MMGGKYIFTALIWGTVLLGTYWTLLDTDKEQ